MRILWVLCFTLVFSCQTSKRNGGGGSGNRKSAQISISALQLDTTRPDTAVKKICVKVDGCASGFRTDAEVCTDAGELRIPVGDTACKIKLQSFAYEFPAGPGGNPAGGVHPVPLSPDQRDRLADSAKGELIQFSVPSVDPRYSFALIPSSILPSPVPDQNIDVGYQFKVTFKGDTSPELKLRDLVGEKFHHFLEVCENEAGHGANAGELALLHELKIRILGLNCREMAQSMETNLASLVLSDISSGAPKTLDLGLIKEFSNLKKIETHGFIVHLPAHLPADLELTVKGVLRAEDWIKLPAHPAHIKSLTLDHVMFPVPEGQKKITEILHLNVHSPWMKELTLNHVVHENYLDLDELSKTVKINLHDTYLFGVALTPPTLDTIALNGPTALQCEPLTTPETCMFAQCVWQANRLGDKCVFWRKGLGWECEKTMEERNCYRKGGCVWAGGACNLRSNAVPCESIKLKWKCEEVAPGCNWDGGACVF